MNQEQSPRSLVSYLLNILSEVELPQRRFVLPAGSYVIGSGSEVDILLPADGVSRRHAVIEVLPDGGALIEDLDSKNGTFIHGRRIRRAVVPDGTLLRFGVVEAQLLDRGGPRHALAIEISGREISGSPDSPALVEDHSTARMRAADRVLSSACEHLANSAQRAWGLSGLLTDLAEDWLLVMPAQRVEFLRRSHEGETAVLASASKGQETPERKADLKVRTSQLAVEIWGKHPPELQALARPIELCLYALEGWLDDSAGGRSVEAINVASVVREPGMVISLHPGLRRLYRKAAKVAQGEIPILIVGPSGAGKEVLARFIHDNSQRGSGPFVALNCTALPGELLEAELFGIERGVATGVEGRPGFIEQAEGGTLFLDEIGDMPVETQAKVLRVLEGEGFYRVGGRKLIPVDVRIIAATNRSIDQFIADGAFREDLYHRIAAFVARVPPLSDRPEDIPALASRFFAGAQEKSGIRSPGITRAALAAMLAYPWPGNVRELKNEIAKAALLLEGGEALDVEHLSEAIRGTAHKAGELMPLSLAEAVARAEERALRVALAASGGDAGRARELLGIGKTSFYAKLKTYGINGRAASRQG